MNDFESLIKKFAGMRELDEATYKATDKAGEFVRDDARLRVRVDTGDLRKSIDYITEKKEDYSISTVFTNSDHAAYVEFGTGPVGAANHDGISPNVTPIYADHKWRGVIPGLKTDTDPGIRMIAGQPAHPYMYPAIADNREEIKEIIGEAVINHMKGVKNG